MTEPKLSTLKWKFPAKGVHRGIPLGNGTFGALLWDGEAQLRVTVNRADYWDHHGGYEWEEEATYSNLRQWLEEGNEAKLKRVFEGRTPLRPTRLPMGRVDVLLCAKVRKASLELSTGLARLDLRGGSIRAFCLRDEPVLWMRLEGVEPGLRALPTQAPDFLERAKALGYPPAEPFAQGEFGGWVQERPNEPSLCVGYLKKKVGSTTDLLIGAFYANEARQARNLARRRLSKLLNKRYARVKSEVVRWWRQYWAKTCFISIPNRTLELLYYIGIYKLAGISVPGSPPATLQGPWVEEHRLPPWGSDYHLNINLQECYWPVYGSNHLECLEPLFELLRRWEPKMREYARILVGIDDGYHLPHALDDLCTCMGGFWTGSTDHACVGWVAQLLWLYYRHTLDREFLVSASYPLMKGAMRVYEEVLEEDGGGLVLPVGVSPEFGGADFGAWGRNASFQLAVIHFLCSALLKASQLLGIDADRRRKWVKISSKLPKCATDPSGREIALWEGLVLPESHRHHSHLAGLYPFDIFDYYGSERERELIDSSLHRLVQRGMGQWSGWSMPWASILFGRTGNGEMAELLLEIYDRVFTNEGYASLHDARLKGFTVICGRDDLMQIEASMGASTAVLDMLLQCSRGVIRLFPAVPRAWGNGEFSGFLAEGAFLFSAVMKGGRVRRVELKSLKGATLQIENPFGLELTLLRRRKRERLTGRLLRIQTHPDETLMFLPAERNSWSEANRR